tara:strand:+ start:162 stop:479 length:318 start_codon:yes stop_codon:yes gene_type:complete
VFCDPLYQDSFADYSQPFSNEQLTKLIKVVESCNNVWLCNGDSSGDIFFDNVQATVVNLLMTYTVGSCKKTHDSVQAKKPLEGLIFRNLAVTPCTSLFYQESSNG